MTSYGIILEEKRFHFNPKLNSTLIPAQVVFLALFWLFVARKNYSIFLSNFYLLELAKSKLALLGFWHHSWLLAGQQGETKRKCVTLKWRKMMDILLPPQADLCITPQNKRVAVLQRLGAHGKCTKAGAGWWEATAGDDTDVCRSLPSGLYDTSVKLRL